MFRLAENRGLKKPFIGVLRKIVEKPLSFLCRLFSETIKQTIACSQQRRQGKKAAFHAGRPAKVPKDLDFLWADLLIPGDYAPVSRILDVFDGPDQLRTAIEASLKRDYGRERETDALWQVRRTQTAPAGCQEPSNHQGVAQDEVIMAVDVNRPNS